MMNKVQSDQVMTDVDLFNIIGNPALSFIPHDARVLASLMENFGVNKLNPEKPSVTTAEAGAEPSSTTTQFN